MQKTLFFRRKNAFFCEPLFFFEPLATSIGWLARSRAATYPPKKIFGEAQKNAWKPPGTGFSGVSQAMRTRTGAGLSELLGRATSAACSRLGAPALPRSRRRGQVLYRTDPDGPAEGITRSHCSWRSQRVPQLALPAAQERSAEHPVHRPRPGFWPSPCSSLGIHVSSPHATNYLFNAPHEPHLSPWKAGSQRHLPLIL